MISPHSSGDHNRGASTTGQNGSSTDRWKNSRPSEKGETDQKDGNITFLWICSQNLLVTPWTLPCVYLLDILLEYTELQSLVQSDLSMLPNVLQTPLMVKNLMNHVQDTVHLQRNTNVSLIGRWCRHVSYWEHRDTDRFGVICSGCKRFRVAWTERPLEDIQQGFTILTHLQTHKSHESHEQQSAVLQL